MEQVQNKHPIRYVIFDLGNVLLHYRPEIYLAETYSEAETISFLIESVFKSPEWEKLDRGSVSREDAICSIANRHPDKEGLIREVLFSLSKMLTQIPSSTEVVRRLWQAGYKLYVLSNFHIDAYRAVKEKYDFFDCFCGEVISASVKRVKPEVEIYQILISSYQLVPEESLFIDDVKENIDAAKSLGFKCLHLRDHRDLASSLLEYGIRM